MPPQKSDRPLPFLREEALDRIGGDVDFLNELLALYDDEYASKIAGLRAAITACNMGEVRTLGHGLKGSSANLSLPGLLEAASAMETAGQEKNPAAAKKAFARLEEEYQQLKAFTKA
jgi:HPt (histidine-containing phosphotransfer) domain-containing protein